MSDPKITILNSIIGINPTGTLEYQGTYTLNGNNNNIRTNEQISKENLEKTLNGEVICNNVETFMNQNNIYNTNNTNKQIYTQSKTQTQKQKQAFLNNIIIIFYILILILILISYLKKIFIYNIKNAKK
jgi:hypothetical protein